ncbi:MAG: hypothetical protein ACLFM0_05215 [Spirochaetales bacterium]
MSNPEAPWFRLDNAALIFPAIAGRRHTTVFRISVSLKEMVDLARLDAALQRIARRTPYFQVELRRGFFWYLLETNRARPRVMPDSRHPNIDFRLRGANRFLYRVRAYRNRIALEVSHILTDGAGALRFLRSLVAEYLFETLGERVPLDETDLLDPDHLPTAGEGRDSFHDYYRPDIPVLHRKEPAWRLSGRPVSSRYFVTTGRVPYGELSGLARGIGVKLTSLLVAFHTLALAEVMKQSGTKKQPIRILVPVNLRQFFPSETMRNFFLYVDPEIDPRLGTYSLEEAAHRISRQMELGLDRRELSRHLRRNIGSERHPILRLLPRSLKDRVLSYVYQRVNEPQFSGSLSNLGRFSLPGLLDSEITGVEFVPPPSPVARTNCGVISRGEEISITFGSLISDRSLEREFFRLMVSRGLPVALETNYTSRQDTEWPTATDAE